MLILYFTYTILPHFCLLLTISYLYNLTLLYSSEFDDIRATSLRIDSSNKQAGQAIRFAVGKAFNRLDVTIESAHLVVDSLLEYIGQVVRSILVN